jgi:TetR/AcrR family transcriptional regulator
VPPTVPPTGPPTIPPTVLPSSPDSRPRRGGRPRLDRRPVTGDPTDEILAAASRLFQQLGVEGTTMSRLAAEVGLKQSSLYYYFPNRDAVLATLVAQANVVPLELVGRIVADGGSAPAQLYRFVRGDVEALCALPFDINEIHRVATRDRDRFAGYWRERGRLERQLASLVKAGLAAGELRTVDARLTALTIMSNDEGVQNWYRLGTVRRPRAIGEALAAMVVGGLLTDGRSVDDVRREVSTLY